MNKAIVIAALVAMAAPLASAAWPAGTTELELLGKDPGPTSEAYSCFSRRYDDAHLASHPNQNVRNIKVFVDSSVVDGGDRQYSMTVGVEFRKLKHEFDISGGCMTGVDGHKFFDCGADCDGGSFNITTEAVPGIQLAIPGYIHLWDPAADDNSDTPLPKAATLGSDDELFNLDRVDAKECKSLMNDDTIAAIFGKKQ